METHTFDIIVFIESVSIPFIYKALNDVDVW